MIFDWLGHVQKVSTGINSSHGTDIGVGSTKQHPEWNRGGCTSSSSQQWRNLQGRAGAGLALRACPTCRLTRLEPQHFRVLLLRRLQLPLPLSVHSCRCGHPLDQFGHHRAACARAGILGKRGFALESVIARVCRKAGGRVTTNVLFRELDFGLMNEADGRRLEVVADGFPLFGGAQLAVVVHCAVTKRRESLWRQLDVGKRDGSQSWWVPGPKVDWWCLGWKSEAAGQESPKTSSTVSPGHVREVNSQSSAVEQNRLGAFDGVPWCLVWWHVQWLLHCWGFLGLSVRMGTPLWSTTWSVTCLRRVLLCDAGAPFLSD